MVIYTRLLVLTWSILHLKKGTSNNHIHFNRMGYCSDSICRPCDGTCRWANWTHRHASFHADERSTRVSKVSVEIPRRWCCITWWLHLTPFIFLCKVHLNTKAWWKKKIFTIVLTGKMKCWKGWGVVTFHYMQYNFIHYPHMPMTV